MPMGCSHMGEKFENVENQNFLLVSISRLSSARIGVRTDNGQVETDREGIRDKLANNIKDD